jgi:hypothetical protein
MTKKKHINIEYDKPDLGMMLFNSMPVSESRTLFDYLLEVYPDKKSKNSVARSKILKEWYETTKAITEPEPLLFMAAVCGAYFRISHPEIREYLEKLWIFLTQGKGNRMDHELAEILIESLAPLLERTLEMRGYKRGWPEAEYVSKKGQPPLTRGAWVSAFLIDNHLGQIGIKATKAKEIALELIAILLGREIIDNCEFYRIYRNAPKSIIPELVEKLIREYRGLVLQDRLREDVPISGDLPDEQLKPPANNKMLQASIQTWGYAELCRLVLNRIPLDLLKPFWDIKID